MTVLTQTAAALRLGVEQPDVSKLLKGHFRQRSRKAATGPVMKGV